MKKWKGMVGVLACAFLYSSMYLLPYIKYIFYDAIVAATGFTNTQIGITLSVYIVAAIISTGSPAAGSPTVSRPRKCWSCPVLRTRSSVPWRYCSSAAIR